jgi:superfamily I DNA/RNA helicase
MATELTTQQQRVVDEARDFLLLACPGSGKTRSAAARVELRARDGASTAVCSYTNVGVERFAQLLAEANVVLGSEHFLGTIHALLLKFVVYPFAHLVGVSRPPSVRYGTWPNVFFEGNRRKPISLGCFRRTRTGQLVVTELPRHLRSVAPEDIVLALGPEVIRKKDSLLINGGVMSPDDAMWVALQILTRHPAVAAAVASRFDEILLDEAQDTSELQLACLHRIRATGWLKSLVLVGDLEQSIYSFQGADSTACRKLAEYHGLKLLELTENHRSSQRICDVAARFCAREVPDTAVGPNAGCEIVPEVAVYPANDPPAAMNLFRSRLKHHGIESRNAAVLVRRWAVAEALSGQPRDLDIEPRPRRIGQIARAVATGTLTRTHLIQAQQIVSYAAYGVENLDELDEHLRESVIEATYKLLDALPALDGDLRMWIKAAAQALDGVTRPISDPPAHAAGMTLRTSSGQESALAATAFAPRIGDLVPQTVHDIKGEDREAIMMVVHRPHAADPTKQLAIWEAAVSGGQLEDHQQEERRITFVALTRAQRYCFVALPDDARGRAVATACVDFGFSSVS